MELLIRKAVDLDIQVIGHLHRECTLAVRALVPSGFGSPMDVPANAETFREMLGQEEACLLVAEADGEVSGFASGWQEKHTDDLFEAPFWTIEFVAVSASHRRRGIAMALIAAMEEEARRRGLKRIDLLVMHQNAPATRLYKKLGYLPLEIRMGKTLPT